MHEISTSSIRTTQVLPLRTANRRGNVVAPSGVASLCHQCASEVVYQLSKYHVDVHRTSVFGSAPCPSCTAQAHFIYASEQFSSSAETIHSGKLYVFPAPHLGHEKIRIPATVNEQLAKSYTSTVDTFNTKNYVATAAGCRRTLEGIFKLFLSENVESKKEKTLYKIIEQIAESSEIKEPLKQLAHAIREGGNLGAHFESGREPDREMAEAMVYLLEYLITYMYVLPDKIAIISEDEAAEETSDAT